MEKKDYTELIVQSGNIFLALKGLQNLLFCLPSADEVKISDIDQIGGTVAAITALAEKGTDDLIRYFDY